MKHLSIIQVTRKKGSESFHNGGAALGPRLEEYWQWTASDIIGNTERGGIAEYLVALDLGVADGVRNSWEAWDLTTPDGVKVEVKSSAYIQSWAQRDYSRIEFGVGPHTKWDAETNTWTTERKRHSDVYVFCLLAHKDQATLDPLDVSQWEFHVLSTAVLNRELGPQERLSMPRLLGLDTRKVQFGGIAETVAGVAAR